MRNELYHHGILGQRWGKRNGPPYPLGTSEHSASEKKAGWRRSLDKTPKNKYNGDGSEKENTDDKLVRRGKKAVKIALISIGAVAVTSLAVYGAYKYRALQKIEEGKRVEDFLDEIQKRNTPPKIIEERFLTPEPFSPEAVVYNGKNDWLGSNVLRGLAGNARTFSNAADAHAYNTERFFAPKLWDSLTDNERNAVISYTGDKCKIMNEVLRRNTMKTSLDREEVNFLIKDCTSALEKTVLKEDVLVTRGLDKYALRNLLGVEDAQTQKLDDPAFLKTLVGKVYTEKGFISTGGSEFDGFSTAAKIHIFAPKGTRGMYVAPVSNHDYEHELLLQRNTEFKITDFKLNEKGELTDLMVSAVRQLVDETWPKD